MSEERRSIVDQYEEKRFGFDWDGWEEGKKNEDLFELIRTENEEQRIKYLNVANFEGGFEGENCQLVIDWLVENKGLFAELECLRMADMEQEECELSWICQGDYNRLWKALPSLKHIIVQGSEGLKLGLMESDSLESIEIISGGLPKEVFYDLMRAKAPNLRKLNLYLGVENYGFDGNVEDVKKLLAESDFPKLEYLGLCNSEIADEMIDVILSSKYAGQIQTLDLSMSVLTDDGAKKLLEGAEKLTSLKFLDLNYHYITSQYQKKLVQLPFEVDLSDEQEYDTEESFYNQPMFTE